MRRLRTGRRKFNLKLLGKLYVLPPLGIQWRPMMALIFGGAPSFVVVSVNGGPRHIVPVTHA